MQAMVRFAAISKTSSFFEEPVGNSGIWGLSYQQQQQQQQHSSHGARPLFDELLATRVVDEDSFSLALCGAEGHLWLGRVDEPQQYFHGQMQYTPLLSGPAGYVHYAVEMLDISVAGVPLGITVAPHTIVDTGTTFLILPRPAHAVLLSTLRARMPHVDPAIWSEFCIATDPAEWPVLTIHLRGVAFAVSGHDYLNPQGNYRCLGIGAASLDAAVF